MTTKPEHGMSEKEGQPPISPGHGSQHEAPSAGMRRLSLLFLFRLFASVGLQSFGGGAATLFLIRQAVVEREQWLSNEEFTHYWSICQVAPGINLLGLVSLIGWRVGGWRGVAVSLCGLLLPSASITVALTSIYSELQNIPLVRSAIMGVIPATVGLGLLTAIAMMRPLLVGARKAGWLSAAVAVLLLAASVSIAARGTTPVLAILWGAGVIAALVQHFGPRVQSAEEPQTGDRK